LSRGAAPDLDCLLVSPPAWYPYQPYLALPALQAHLRQQGFGTRILDLNLGYLDAQLRPAALEVTLRRAEERTFGRRPAWLGAAQQQKRERLFRRTALAAEEVHGQLEDALRTLRGAGYYDYGRRAEATKAVYWALQALHVCYFPTAFDGNDLRFRLHQTDPGQLFEIVSSPEENLFLEYLEEALRGVLAGGHPRAVGIGIAGLSQLVGGLTVAWLVKRLAPEVHVVVGGSYFSRLEAALHRFPEVFSLVDSIVTNEGEIPLAEILSRLADGGSLDGVPQRIGRSAKGEVVSERGEALPDVDALPTPDYEGMALDKYLVPVPVLSIASTRGCYWRRCAFCDHGFCYQGSYRERSNERVVDDLRTLEERHGSGRYEFVDEALEPSRVEQLSSGIRAARLDVRWCGMARIDGRWSAERFALAREAGCELLSFGVESHDDAVLRRMRKGTSARLNLRVLRQCHEAGIRTHALVFFGFPGESDAASEATMSLVDAHAELFDDGSSAPFTLGRQSPVLHEAGHFGVELPAGWESAPEHAYALSLPYLIEGQDTLSVAEARAKEFKNRLTRKKGALDRTTAFLYSAHFGRVDLADILARFEAEGRERRLPRLGTEAVAAKSSAGGQP
jgi:anaerobic magnesium-protoporphyrin IX monomethyl ester cyclase